IRILRARHRSGPAHVFLLREFRLELLARSAGTGAVRTSGLRHEALDHAMEDDSVIKSRTHQFLDARDMARRQVGPHPDGNGALARLEDQRVFRIAHGCSVWVGKFRLSTNRIAIGRPAMAPPRPAVKWSGVQPCSAPRIGSE